MFDIVPLPYYFVGRISRGTPYSRAASLSDPPPSSFPNQVFQLLSPSTLIATHNEISPSRSYRMQWNLNIQRQLTNNLALTLGYAGSAGVHLWHPSDDVDQVPAPLVRFDSAVNSYIFPVPPPGSPIQRINQNYGRIISSDFSGQSNYHGLQSSLVQRPLKGLAYQVSYTWSQSIDNGSVVNEGGESGNTAGASWIFDPRINRGVSDFNVPHNLVFNFQYELPVPAFAKSNALANTLLAGWQVGGIYTRQSGGPFTVRLGSDQALTGNTQVGNGAQRPQFANAQGCTPNAITGNINRYIRTECFTFPFRGQLGNLGRNTLRMPVFRNLDFSIYKNQNVWGEKLKAQFRLEIFNILNNTNFTGQTQTIFDGTGRLVTTVGTPVAPTANTSRQVQLGLRLLF